MSFANFLLSQVRHALRNMVNCQTSAKIDVMKGFASRFVIVLFLTCSSTELTCPKNSECVDMKLNEDSVFNINVVNQKGMMDSIVLVQLSNGIVFNWNNKSFCIVEDNLFSSVVTIFSQKQQSIVACILDTTKTPAKVCSLDRNLLVGDLTFLLIDKVKSLPYFKALGVQWDTFDTDCNYPFGLFDYINNYRDEVSNKVGSYLTLKE